ncbi:hypothetical protein NWT09_14100 [Mycolicibacterium sp. jd]|uniref:hypothetical protein n=1 Tax=unclassified Mycolicibacterium TaxID=2636767 RepID=UPI00351B51FD
MSGETEFFDQLPPREQQILRRAMWKYLRRNDDPDLETLIELTYWQQLENDVLDAHITWLTRTKARFEAQGIPWTTGELMRRAHVWEQE